MAITRIGNPAIADQRGVNFRNIIINGDMSIAQRGTSVTGVGNGDNSCQTVDRLSFYEEGGTSGEFTMSQENDVPTGQGFAKSTKLDCTTADASLAATEVIALEYKFEGQMLQYLKKGTSNAESLTLSFWVKTNKTGTYVANFYDNDNNRHTSQNYTVSSANTWEKKIITFAPDTSGTLTNDNTLALAMYFILGAGTSYTSGSAATAWETFSGNADNWCGGQNVNLLDNTSNEFYITGVQLEAGTTASDFEFLPFDVNEERCKRYYQLIASGVSDRSIATGVYYTSSRVFGNIFLTKIMRVRPSLDLVSGTNYYVTYSSSAADQINDFALDNSASDLIISIQNQSSSGTQGYAGMIRTNNSSAFLGVDAEL